jgi:hypothetical protein
LHFIPESNVVVGIRYPTVRSDEGFRDDQIVGKRNQLGLDLSLISGQSSWRARQVNLLRPDEVKEVIGPQSSLKWHVKMVDEGSAIIIVSDFGRWGVNMRMSDRQKANKQEKYSHCYCNK